MSRPLQLLKRELKLQHQQQETGDGGSFAGSWCKWCCSFFFNLLKWINCAGGGAMGGNHGQASNIRKSHKYVLHQRCIHYLFRRDRCMKNPEDNSHVISLKDARSHVDHLHFLDVLASRPSRPRKRAKGKGVWILSAWSPSEPIIDLSASGRVDDSFLLWPLRYLSLTPDFWVQIDLGTQTGSFPSSQ